MRFCQAAGLVIVDPNPRPNLIADIVAYRARRGAAMAAASVAKLSDEDAHLLYDCPARQVPDRSVAMGVETVLLTHGSAGASCFEPCRAGVYPVPIARGEGPVIDAMGAGDATLATVIAAILRRGMPSTEADWHDCLTEAMRVAAATCASPGGSLVLPAGQRALV